MQGIPKDRLAGGLCETELHELLAAREVFGGPRRCLEPDAFSRGKPDEANSYEKSKRFATAGCIFFVEKERQSKTKLRNAVFKEHNEREKSRGRCFALGSHEITAQSGFWGRQPRYCLRRMALAREE